MTATNHALTGTAIGLIVGQPLLALPLALLSHYICDAIPHWRMDTVERLPDEVLHKKRSFHLYLLAEAFVCFLIVVALFILQPDNWLLAAVCAFVAAAPDLLSIGYFSSSLNGKKWRPNAYTNFAKRIQWFERPSGAFVEAVWLVALIGLITSIVK